MENKVREFSNIPKKAMILDKGNSESSAVDEQGEHDDDTVWEVESSDFITNEVPENGITVNSSAAVNMKDEEGKHLNILDIELERYMLMFILANILFFGGYFGVRLWTQSFCILMLLSLLFLLASFVDKHLNGIHLYPVYQHMVENGFIFDPGINRIVPINYWFERNLKQEGEEMVNRDILMLNNWKPHSYVLTNQGIYLEKRKDLIAGQKFIYIPLLSMKAMKLSHEKLNRNLLGSFAFTVFWAFLIGPGDAFFMILMFVACIELMLAFVMGGTQIKGRALNLTFSLSRLKDKKRVVEQRMLEIDGAHRKRMQDPDAQREIQTFVGMEKLPSCPGLQDLKKSVRSASTGIVLPVFFFSMMRLLKIMEVDTSGFEIIAWLLIIFSLWRIMTAIFNVWNYQKYLERPEGGYLDLVVMKISFPELLVVLGYLILSISILRAVSEDMLSIAFIPGIIGGLVILAGRYLFNSTFKGIDYMDKVSKIPRENRSALERFLAEDKRMLAPVISFIILLMLTMIIEPYFGETRADVSEDHLEPRAGNNWRRLQEEDEDISGLMGMFGLTVRVYEDDGEDNDDYYPAVLSVVSFKFPVTPDEKDMLDEMKEHLEEFSKDQSVRLEEPPVQGQAVNVQGYMYQYFIYNGTATNLTTRFSRGEEMRIISIAFKVDDKKSFVVAVGIAKISEGRLIDIELPPPLPPIPNPTDTRDNTTWNELKDDLIPNIRVS